MTDRQIMRLLSNTVNPFKWLRKNLSSDYQCLVPRKMDVEHAHRRERRGTMFMSENMENSILGNLAFVLRDEALGKDEGKPWFDNIESVFKRSVWRKEKGLRGKAREEYKNRWLAVEATAREWIVIALLGLNRYGPFKVTDKKSESKPKR